MSFLPAQRRTLLAQRIQYPIASCSGIIGGGDRSLCRRFFGGATSENSCHADDRRGLMRMIAENDPLRDSVVYSLALATRDGSRFPPFTRRLNDREREQIRISETQRRLFCEQAKKTTAAAVVAIENDGGDSSPLAEDRQRPLRGDNNNHNASSSVSSPYTSRNNDDAANSMAYSLSFSSSSPPPVRDHDDPSGSSSSPLFFGRPLNDLELQQLSHSRDRGLLSSSPPFAPPPLQPTMSMPMSITNHHQNNNNNSSGTVQQRPLPRTLRDALHPMNFAKSSDAIVVTESAPPFRVFGVNKAWEGLCGYTHVESKGKSLGTLLGGRETDHCAVTALMNRLFCVGEKELSLILTNYAKNGRKFRNRLRVGPIYSEDDNNDKQQQQNDDPNNGGGRKVTHFVGILKEVEQEARA